jgi:hypothetical protein
MGTLTLSITENINLSYGGYEYNYTTSGTSDDLNIADVDAYNIQTLSVPTAFTQVAKFSSGATPGMGLYDSAKVKYMRFRNTDSSNFITLQLSDATTNKQVNYKLLAGEAMYFTTLVFDCNASTSTASKDVVQGTPNVTALAATADEVLLKADTAAVSVDILIAYDL